MLRQLFSEFVFVGINQECSYQIPMDFKYLQLLNKQHKMTERRSWTEQEDKALKYLRDTLQVKKWSEISRRLEFQFNLPGRNGKQCRERYTNHLDSSIIAKELTFEDEEKLFELHDKIGNKWSLISKQFMGRTDNQIKNHFHSKLRKAIRKLNREIKQHLKKSTKLFKLNIIYKVVESSDYRFSEKVVQEEELSIDFNELKNFLLQYAGGNVTKTELSDMKSSEQTHFLVVRLQEFEKYFKNKKLKAKSDKVVKIGSDQSQKRKSSKQHSTQNSECSSQMEKQLLDNEIEEEDSIYEDASFQFIGHTKELNSSYKSMEEETNNSSEQLKQDRVNSCKSVGQGCGSFYSFLNNQNKNSDQKNKFDSIPLSLIQEKEFPEIPLDKKFSVKSFESLREYEDSLNDSELNLMMRRFDSYSDIEAGLFQ